LKIENGDLFMWESEPLQFFFKKKSIWGGGGEWVNKPFEEKGGEKKVREREGKKKEKKRERQISIILELVMA
jgi:hypothetical protein